MITTIKGDITGLDFDLIINPSNRMLEPTAGINGKIFDTAGNELVKACRQLQGCDIGKAKMTDAYKLPCKKIIHAVIPYYIDGEHDENEYLAACYWNSLALAYKYMQQNDLEHVNVAFPSLAQGLYGFDRKSVIDTALMTIRQLFFKFPESRVINICFVCDNDADYSIYKEALRNK